MSKFSLFFVALSLWASLAAANDLKCWDCGDSDQEKCQRPQENNVQSVVCDSTSSARPDQKGVHKAIADIDRTEIEPRLNREKSGLTYECFSFYFVASPNDSSKTGVYRGCSEKSAGIESSCNYLTENFVSHGNITKCLTCSTDKCNDHDVGASGRVSFSILLFILTVFIATTL